ncbi:MAG: hypothetical protein ACXV1K_02145 [Kineosporiaceae bacterium]
MTLEGERATGHPHADAAPLPATDPERISPAGRSTTRHRPGTATPLEVALVVVACVVATMVSNLPQVTGLSTAVPGDLGDPLYFAWQMAWVGHQLPAHAGELWTTNAFLGAPDSLAFTDAVLGYLPVSWLGEWLIGGQGGALLALNLASLLATALALFGGYALARALGAGLPGALVAGAGFGFAPWRLTQATHVNVLSTGGMALALACLALGRGWSLRDGWRPERMRTGWVVTGWAVACWQLTLGFAVGIPFGYVVLGLSALAGAAWLRRGRRREPRGHRRVVVADAAGAVAFCAVALALSRPYERVVQTQPGAQRSAAMADLFSPPWQGLLTAPETSRFWGSRQIGWRQGMLWPPEMTLSPGVLLVVLGILGVSVSVWPRRRRRVLAGVGGAITLLVLGSHAPGPVWQLYLALYHHLPGWNALRTPGRLVIWLTLVLALLAGGYVDRVGQLLAAALARRARAPSPVPAASGVRARGARAVVPALVAVVPLGLIGYEGLGDVPHWPLPPPPVDIRGLPAPVMFLPTDPIGDYATMLWSTQGWPLIGNGNSGFDPPSQIALRNAVRDFPSAASLAALRARGVRTVVLVPSRAAGTPWAKAADASVAGLPLRRRVTGDAVVYDLG